jgi:hypothetical protein
MQLLDKVQILNNLSGHPFRLGEIVKVFRIFGDDTYDVCNKNGDCWRVNYSEILELEDPMKQMTEAVINTAKNLCKAQNQVTTLEIKTEVMRTHNMYHWTQAFVSAVMDDAQRAGMFTFTESDGISAPRHRIYSQVGVNIPKVKTSTMKTAVAVKTGNRKTSVPKAAIKKAVKQAFAPAVVAAPTKTISKTKALELMENNKGHFFTATFIDKKSQERTMNCQYLKDQTYSKLGYVKVREAIKAKMKPEDCIRQINLQTLKALKIAGNSYKVK